MYVAVVQFFIWVMVGHAPPVLRFSSKLERSYLGWVRVLKRKPTSTKPITAFAVPNSSKVLAASTKHIPSLSFTVGFFPYDMNALCRATTAGWIAYVANTVKPALSDHPTVQEKVVVIGRWSLKQGSLNSGRFSEVLFNIGELRGTHAYDLRYDKSHRPGASGGLVWWFSRKLALWRLFLKRMWGQSNDFSCFWSLKTGKIRPLVQKIRVAGRVRQVVA